jgi:hypothetical protein
MWTGEEECPGHIERATDRLVSFGPYDARAPDGVTRFLRQITRRG